MPASPATARPPAKPVLLQLAHFNTLLGHPTIEREWPLVRKVGLIKASGFDGFTGRVPPVTRAIVATHGIHFWCTIDVGAAADVGPALRAAKTAGATQINCQLADHDTPTRTALSLARRVIATAERMGLVCGVEVHRDTCTETPEKTYALADAFQQAEGRRLPLVWDFSHPAVIKHIRPPFYARVAEREDLVLNSNHYHFRPYNGQHAQIPVEDRRHRRTPEFEDWLQFVDTLLAKWLARARPGQVLWTCPEMIPNGYRLSTFTSNWRQAQIVRNEVAKIWRRHLRRWRPPAA
ncbi:MAG: xylose isomerase [Actinobacteria bacterium]|nr:xylose isomerase [Actinomycetota bacterium]